MSCCGKIIKGAIGLVKAVAVPSDWANGDLVVARRAVCQACPERRGPQCRECGCGIWPKTRLAGETCPQAKWPTALPASAIL